MIILSNKPSGNPQIEIRELNYDSADILKLMVLAKQEMPEYLVGLNLYLKNKSYKAMFGAFDKRTNALVGACLVLDKKIVLEGYEEEIKALPGKTMQLDFLFVDKKYTHQKIGSSLINSVYEYCKNNNYSYIDLMCPLKNSIKKTVYDNNDFNRIAICNNYNPMFLMFRANVNKDVRDIAKALYSSILDAYELGCINYDEYKDELLDGHLPRKISKLPNITPARFKKIVNSEQFNLFDNAIKSVLDEGNCVLDTSDQIRRCLKIKKTGEIPVYKKPNMENIGNSILQNYLTDEYSLKQVNFVNQTFEEVKNKFINDYILDGLDR